MVVRPSTGVLDRDVERLERQRRAQHEPPPRRIRDFEQADVEHEVGRHERLLIAVRARWPGTILG